MSNNVKTWSYNLINDTLTIDPSFGLTRLSILLISGTGSYKGSLQVGNLPSQPIPLQVGTPVNLSAEPSAPLLLGELTLTTTGTILLIGK